MTNILQCIETSTAIISINEEGIGFLHFKDNAHQDISEQMENHEAIKKITGDLPTPFVVSAGEHVTLTREARHNALAIEHLSPMCATAVIVQNLAYRMIAEFYMKIQKPKNPFAVFTEKDKDKAYEWCRQFLVK
ncbi:MAG TPA: hypothetical protein VGC65_12330 [Bacteroidia bacterium]